jgi:predicted PurR-regulated permease PerM
MHFITGQQNVFLLALLIALLDILPIVGTGTVLLPWALISFITGDFASGICLLVIYAVITVIRQFIEPKIVGDQVGLHPVATLIAMIVGTRLFGAIGLFGLPISLAIIKDLNDHGKIHVFKPYKPEPEEEKDEREKGGKEEKEERETEKEPRDEDELPGE